MHDHEVEREKEKLFLRNAEIVAQEEREEKLKKKIETQKELRKAWEQQKKD